MTIEVVEISLAELLVPPSRAKLDPNYAYEHLRRYCSRFRPLPAVGVTSDGEHLVLTTRYQYVAIARDLGDDRIRAVLEGITYEELIQQGVPGILCLVSKEALQRELQTHVLTFWHTVFFKTCPDQATIAKIDARFRGFLQQSLPGVIGNKTDIDIDSEFDTTGPCLEIRFPTPVTNHDWAASFHGLLTSIDLDLAPIDTYLGGRFKP